MGLKSEIVDGLGRGNLAAVGDSHALLVQNLPLTSKGIEPANLNNLRLYRELFASPTGTFNQVVNGSVTPVEFSVKATKGLTKWITGFRINIEAQQVILNSGEFRTYGATAFPGLTNGIQIQSIQSGITTDLAVDPIRILGDYVNYAASSTNLQNVISSSMDFLQFVFVFEQPIVLVEGSTDQLLIRIRDNLTTALTSGGAPVSPALQIALATGYQESV